nr:villin-1 isoform X1 [Tanacetum cinerariifolium]
MITTILVPSIISSLKRHFAKSTSVTSFLCKCIFIESKKNGNILLLVNVGGSFEINGQSQSNENLPNYPYDRAKINSHDPVPDIDITKREIISLIKFQVVSLDFV